MQYAVEGVYHLYFGDASRHPIVNNYLRSLPELPQRIVLTDVPNSRLGRLWRLGRETLRARKHADWALQCHDVVSAVIGSVLWKGRVIYDSHEIYSSFATRRIVAKLINSLEKFAIRQATIVVFPSTYRSEYYDLEDRDVRIVENLYYPYDNDEARGTGADTSDAETGRPQSPLFVYTGLFTPARAIDDIVAAFKSPQLSASRLVLAGKRTDYLDSVLGETPDNVEYVGELGHAEVSELLKSADVGFALYRPVNENNRRCAPTKIFEFLYFGVQVIASQSPYVMEIKERCGGDQIIALDEIDTESIIAACLAVRKSDKSVDRHTRESVCWSSQMPIVKSLYT
ncbi:MAG: glycosyltransferase [Gammaproteobacteria bacterium]|nr:glycosyltransferase [Gammaproteobacteria bacterium]NNL50947.1 glycosyltransferase [Woeseiaceae bacterium]